MRLQALVPPVQPGWLLSFDFDDTLYDALSPSGISPAFFDTIRYLRSKWGVMWGINTGRSFDYLVEGFERDSRAPFAPDFLVTRERDIHLTDQGLHLRELSRWNDTCREAHDELFRHHKKFFSDLILELEAQCAHVDWWLQQDDPYSLEVANPSDLDFACEIIMPAIARYPDISVQRAGPYLRFCHAGYNKGSALFHVASLLGISPGRVVVFGDSYNDLDAMLENPDAFCCCPSNAVESLRLLVGKRQGYVSLLPRSGGVMDALERFVIPLLEETGNEIDMRPSMQDGKV